MINCLTEELSRITLNAKIVNLPAADMTLIEPSF